MRTALVNWMAASRYSPLAKNLDPLSKKRCFRTLGSRVHPATKATSIKRATQVFIRRNLFMIFTSWPNASFFLQKLLDKRSLGNIAAKERQNPFSKRQSPLFSVLNGFLGGERSDDSHQGAI